MVYENLDEVVNSQAGEEKRSSGASVVNHIEQRNLNYFNRSIISCRPNVVGNKKALEHLLKVVEEIISENFIEVISGSVIVFHYHIVNYVHNLQLVKVYGYEKIVQTG